MCALEVDVGYNIDPGQSIVLGSSTRQIGFIDKGVNLLFVYFLLAFLSKLVVTVNGNMDMELGVGGLYFGFWGYVS